MFNTFKFEFMLLFQNYFMICNDKASFISVLTDIILIIIINITTITEKINYSKIETRLETV